MNYWKSVLGIVVLAVMSTSADARDRWHLRQFNPWADEYVQYDSTDDEDVVYYEEDDTEDVIVLNRRQRRIDNEDVWWLDDGAQQRLEKRQKLRRQAEPLITKKRGVQKPAKAAPAPKKVAAVVVRPKVSAAPKTSKPASPKLQTASLAKTSAEPMPKPKTIGCSSGAAIVTGYGFAAVTPKACTGTTYAYNAQRAGKSYVIQLTAATGEITDVKKLN
jgi:hypothetical protein